MCVAVSGGLSSSSFKSMLYMLIQIIVLKIADAAVSQSNRRYYNKPIVHHYGKSIVVQKDKIARSCPALHILSVTIVTSAVTTLPLFQHNIQLGLFLYMEGTSSKQSILHINVKRQRKPQVKSRMDNPEILATLGTQDTRRRQTKTKNTTQKTKKMSNTDPTKNRG